MAQVTLAGARVSAGYSQEELAKQLGVTRQTVARWESDISKMKAVNLYAFCKATGFEPADILLPSDIADCNSEEVGA